MNISFMNYLKFGIFWSKFLQNFFNISLMLHQKQSSKFLQQFTENIFNIYFFKRIQNLFL